MPESLNIFGKFLIISGLVIAAIGVIILLAGRFPGLHIGRLPGDIFYERGNWRLYFPLMTCIIISIILSLIVWLLSRR